MEVLILVILLFLFIILEMPVALALSFSSVIYLGITETVPVALIINRISGGLNSFVLLAMPLFILAGNLMNTSGVSSRIFNFCQVSVGHIKGGLGHVNVLTSVIFSGMSGVAQADAAGLGLIEINEMKKRGYTPEFSAAITAASAIIGPIIPPSVIMVIYGVLTNTSIPELFLAGFIPGVLMSISLMITISILAAKGKIIGECTEKVSFRIWLKSFMDALPSLLAPFILITGMLTGFATPTELGALTSIYAIILGIVYKDISIEGVKKALLDTVYACGTLVFIIAAATPFSGILAIENVPQMLGEAIMGITTNPIVFLLIVNVILLFLGAIMDTTAIMLITMPILAPIATSFGIDLVHFGLIVIINLLLGTLTPPFGILLFIMMDIANISYKKLIKALVPFYICLFFFLLIITFIPQLSLFLPRLFFK